MQHELTAAAATGLCESSEGVPGAVPETQIGWFESKLQRQTFKYDDQNSR